MPGAGPPLTASCPPLLTASSAPPPAPPAARRRHGHLGQAERKPVSLPCRSVCPSRGGGYRGPPERDGERREAREGLCGAGLRFALGDAGARRAGGRVSAGGRAAGDGVTEREGLGHPGTAGRGAANTGLGAGTPLSPPAGEAAPGPGQPGRARHWPGCLGCPPHRHGRAVEMRGGHPPSAPRSRVHLLACRCLLREELF